MSADGIHIDISEFFGWLENFSEDVQKAVYRGTGKAVSLLLNDATTEIPAAPLDEGTLRGSGSAFVNNQLVATNPKTGGEPTPATEDDEKIPPDMFVGVVGFNTPYAAYQHEGRRRGGAGQFRGAGVAGGKYVVKNYTHSGVGPKFLEKKMVDNFETYQAVVGNEVRGVTGGD